MTTIRMLATVRPPQKPDDPLTASRWGVAEKGSEYAAIATASGQLAVCFDNAPPLRVAEGDYQVIERSERE